MKILITLALTLSFTSAFAAAESCRLHVQGYQALIGDDQNLRNSVEKILVKKNIELIDESDLREGDFTTDFLKNFEGYRGLPLHEYMFTKSRKVILLPCMAIPLCSPVGVDEQVTSIDGIKYRDQIRVSLVTSDGKKKILEKSFKHVYRGEIILDHKSPDYFGSAEQIDLVLAVAKKSPDCKSLKKSE